MTSISLRGNHSSSISYNAKEYLTQIKNIWADNVLVDNPHQMEFETYDAGPSTIPTAFLEVDCIIAGSFVAQAFTKFNISDIDVYVKSIEDVKKIVLTLAHCELSEKVEKELKKKKNTNIRHAGSTYNFILRDFKTPEDIISTFDIRAISAAFDPKTYKIHTIKGAFSDLQEMRIVFNPFPKHTSLRRLMKYINKGFKIDRYQTAIFTELIKNPEIHSINLELTTGYGEVTDVV